MRTMFRAGLTALAAAVLLGAARDGEAAYVPVFVGVAAEGDHWRWSYKVDFIPSDPGDWVQGGDGVVDPGAPGSRDFITLFDVGGYVDGSAVAGGGYSLLSPLLFEGASGRPFAPRHDDPDVVNLTFLPQFSFKGPWTFGAFSFLSTVGPDGPDVNASYSSQFSRGDPGVKLGGTGRVLLPAVPAVAVPEPSSLALAGLGALTLAVVSLRRRPA